MDRYFGAKSKAGFSLDKSDLHLIGLVSIYLSSKMEDVYPLSMAKVLEEAGHKKFKNEAVINCERDIVLTLGFKILAENIYN